MLTNERLLGISKNVDMSTCVGLKSFSFLRHVVLKTTCDSFVYYNCVFDKDPGTTFNSVFCTSTELAQPDRNYSLFTN